MNVTEKRNGMSIFEQLKAGLGDSIAYSKGELSLKTTGLPPLPPKAQARDIVSLRRRFNMSQSVFAAVLNVSPRTVQSWEQGAREPSDAALRMIQVVRAAPNIVAMIYTRDTNPATNKSTSRRATQKATRAKTSK